MRARSYGAVLIVACATACSRAPAAPVAEEPDALDGAPLTETSLADEPHARVVPSAAPTRPPATIFRSELARATGGGRPGYLLAQLGPEPYRPTGRFQGWRITRVFPDDPELCRAGCDLHVGDIVVTVNGRFIERPEHLSELMASLDRTSALRVRFIRDGALVERAWSLAEG
jgi:type II secretory pathway component PulC